MKITLIEPQNLYRDGLKCLLTGFAEDFVIRGSASVGDAALLLEEERSDLIILSSRCGMQDGLKEIACLMKQAQGTPIVLLPEFEDLDYFHQALSLGVKGVVAQGSSHEELLAALRLICAGGIYVPSELLFRVRALEVSSASNLLIRDLDDDVDATKMELLSDRQRQVLHYLVQGNANKSISREMNISENTVKTHVSAIFKLLGVSNRTEAVYFANQAHHQKGRYTDDNVNSLNASNF